MLSLETKQLTHYFSKKERVLNDISLQVKSGSIYGFLGPNGAGKTTTLRLILGLLKKQQGEILVFGKQFDTQRTEILKRVGSLIESPSIHSQLTAIENLRVYQKIFQCPFTNMQYALKLVGLEHTGNKKAGRFSLGMKQRLGIAIALLHDPELLILDEPTNGLDPAGIIEMRELLKQLNKEKGITILISSHLLSEIEKLVTHVGLIHKGNMLFQGTLEELFEKQQTSSAVVFETNNPEKAFSIANQLYNAAQNQNNKIIFPALKEEVIADINRRFVEAKLDVYAIQRVTNDLESVFINLTK
ncbi:MAG: ABC transporter ATP-binding protein [Bacteroidia bacterium]|nr:ABC transporter ATP-binding protein [Bacteroidia bacterium]